MSTDASYRGGCSFIADHAPNDTFGLVPSEDLEGAEYAFAAEGTFDDCGLEKHGFDAPDAREEAV